ncbi:MAG: response regulator, partial [Dehalococcoidales bacterium]|nr:response regulator [Dehalococcoidales bacterium]
HVQNEFPDSETSSLIKENSKKTNILVVDDETTVQQFIKSALNLPEYSVETTGEPYEALRKIAANNYDLIVMDIRMPGMSGQELFEKIINDKPYISKNILFTTGDSANSEVKSFLQKYNLRSIDKPFDHQTLMKKIHEILER